MKSLLQIIIDYLTKSVSKYVADDYLVDFLLANEELNKQFKVYLKNQGGRNYTFEELLESNKALVSSLIDDFNSIFTFRVFAGWVIGEWLSEFPHIKEKRIKQIVDEEVEGSILKYIVSPSETLHGIIEKIINDAMRNDTLKKNDQTVEINFQPLEQHFRKLQKTKKDAFILSNTLMYFNWNIQNSKIEQLVLNCFMKSSNKSHISKLLYYMIKREMNFHCVDLHMEVEKKSLSQFITVKDVLCMDSSKWDSIKKVVNESQKKRTTETRLAQIAILLDPTHKQKTNKCSLNKRK